MSVKDHYIIAIDQSTSATKAMLFNEQCQLLRRYDLPHRQYYPQEGWVEHDAVEIYSNTVKAIRQILNGIDRDSHTFSLAITNQRETVVVWDKNTGKPIHKAIVWQDNRGAKICQQLKRQGLQDIVMRKSGLMIDPNFSASGVKWILDNVEGARDAAVNGQLNMGTIDTWLIWCLTDGRSFTTDTTNASRTMLFNIFTMTWDCELTQIFDIPISMLANVLPSDSIFGYTTVEGLFDTPIPIAGVLGDSHGALVGQMCFEDGAGKVTYGTGSSIMVNIGKYPLPAPIGLVTSVGFSALGKHFYGYEGNIYSTGGTLKWMADQLKLVNHPSEIEAEAVSVKDNGGVYFVPAFAGLGAPWWNPNAKAGIVGMTFSTTRAHFLRAALESIAYQIKDLIDVMEKAIGGHLKEICADGGPTRNNFLMQFQSDLLSTPVVCTEVEDASALGAVIMNGFARKIWTNFNDVIHYRKVTRVFEPQPYDGIEALYAGWRNAVIQLTESMAK